MSKWVDVVATHTNDHKIMFKFIKHKTFSRFGISYVIISGGEKHFKNIQIA